MNNSEKANQILTQIEELLGSSYERDMHYPIELPLIGDSTKLGSTLNSDGTMELLTRGDVLSAIEYIATGRRDI